MHLSKKQTDRTNAFVENDGQSRETQWAMGNVKSVSKKFKKFRFLRRQLAQIFFPQKISQHSAQVNGVLSSSAKTLALPSLLERQNSKI